MKDKYYTDGDKHITQMMDDFYLSNYTVNSAAWQEGYIDKRFKVGDQALLSMMYGDTSFNKNRRFFFNLIRRHINMIAGYQRKNRKSTIAVPIHDVDDKLADDFTACLMWSERMDGSHEYISQAFEGALDTGIAMLHLYMDYAEDPISGDLKLDNVSYNNFLIDSYWRKQDLSDCNGIWRRRWVSKDMAKTLLPGRDEDISRICSSQAKDGRFPLQAELMNLDTNKLINYDEFHYRDTREITQIIDTKTGEVVEWDDEAEDIELEIILSQQPWLKTRKTQKSTVKLAIKLGSQVVYNGPNILGVDSYPFVPVVCYHEPDLRDYSWRLQGIVRNMRDAQYLYNQRKVIELDILESQINSGWIFPVDAVTDPKAFRQTGQGFLVPLKAGHSPAEIQRIEAPGIPASMIELSRSLSEDITKISGVNEELLGSAEDDKSGILSMLRQGAGLTTLQGVFDKLDYSQKLLGRLRIEAMRKNFSSGKVKQILGRDPDPKFFVASSSKYDLAVEEGLYSTTQKQMELKQLLYFKEMGIAISDEAIIKASSVSNKQALIEGIEQQKQAEAQAQEAATKLQEQQSNSQQMTDFAKARSDLALAQERAASAELKMAQMQQAEAKSEVDYAKADLDLVEQLIRLEDADRAGIMKALQLADMIKAKNEQNNLLAKVGKFSAENQQSPGGQL